MKKSVAVLVAVGMLVSACQTNPAKGMIFIRTDGHRSADNPRYAQQFEIDKQICLGEVNKAAVGAPVIYWSGIVGALAATAYVDQQTRALVEVLKGCMASHGYLLVPESQAAAISASFRKN